MKKVFIASIIILVNFFSAKATNYYFSSVNGLDSRTAIEARNPATPWASYSKLDSIFSTLLPGDSALFHRGETFYTNRTLTLSRSGTALNGITIGAYGTGARPIITSLIPLTWTNAGGNLWRSNQQINLSSLTLVTVNNIPHEMGRWPNRDNGNNGYNTVVNPTTNSITQMSGAELVGQPAIYPGAILVYRPETFWMGLQRITGYNYGTKVISFALAAGTLSPTKGFGYFIQHDSNTLDQQNEWWFNQITKKLKIYSSGSPAGVKAATLKIFVYAAGKSFINIHDLNFNGCDSDAIRTTTGAKLKITNCIIQNIGRNGIKTTTDDLSILQDSIVNCLSKGVLISDGDRSIIKYNTIRNTGQLIGHNTSMKEEGRASHSGVGIYIAGGGADIIIEYNRVINSGHNGIHLRHWNRGKVRYNFIDSVDNIMDDGGGIYTFEGDFNRDERNRVITGNIILNGIGAPKGGSKKLGAGAGVAGLYFDRGSHDITADSNFVAYYGQGTLINFGSNHITARNNTFYSNTLDGIQINTRLDKDDTTRSLVVTNNTVIAALTFQKTLVLFTRDGDVLNEFGTIDYNIYARPLDDDSTMSYQSGKLVEANLPQWKTHFPGYDQHSKRSPFLYSNLIDQENNTSFYLNDSIAPKSIFISDSSQDINLKNYVGTTTLNRSLFLFKTGGTVPSTMYTLTTSTIGSGTVSKNPNQASYAFGTSVTLTATPSPGYLFSSWSGGATGSSNPLSLTMGANKSITATFTAVPPAMYGLTLLNVGGGSATASPTGPSYTSGTSVTITATPSAGYQFTGWSGSASGTTNPLSVSMTSDKSITATYDLIQYTLTVNITGSGSVSKTPDQVSYASGSTVNLIATPSSGYLFSGWSGSASGTANELSVTMSASKTITAIFTAIPPITYTLTLINTGSGTTSASPTGPTYNSGTSVTVTATPSTGYTFTGWSGNATGTTNPLSVTMSADKSITATFTAIPPTMYGLTLINSGSGLTTASPTGPSYNSGTSVTLTATPGTGYLFSGWSGNASGTTNPLSVTMSSDKTITANYTAIQYTLTASIVGSGSVSKTPSQATYNAGSTVTVIATPATGYLFTGWSGDASGTANELSLTMGANKSITATFTAVPPAMYGLTLINAGSGTVSASPSASNYSSGTSVIVTATPSAGYNFTGWSGDASGGTNPLTITMSSDKTITATFTAIPPTLYGLTLINVGSGSTTASPAASTYSAGSSVIITATPAAGYLFSGWSGDASGTMNPLTIAMTSGKTITATYELITYTLTANIVGGGTIDASPALARYDSASVTTLTATPLDGYEFYGWSGDASGTTNEYEMTMNGNKTVTAIFTLFIIPSQQNILNTRLKIVIP